MGRNDLAHRLGLTTRGESGHGGGPFGLQAEPRTYWQAAAVLISAYRAGQREVRVGMSNSFGVGGQNTTLLFRRWDA